MADIEEPILGTDPDDIPGNMELAGKILIGGAYDHLTEYPDIPVLKVDYQKFLTDTTNFYNHRKGNTDNLKQAQDNCKLLHAASKQILEYVLPIAIGNHTLIQLSGFPSSSDSKPHSLIGQIVIKNIMAGIDEFTVKILIEKLTGDERSIKASKTYIVRVYDDSETNVFRIGCITSDSDLLIVKDVPLLKPQWYAIIVSNSAGLNQLSAKRRFTLAN